MNKLIAINIRKKFLLKTPCNRFLAENLLCPQRTQISRKTTRSLVRTNKCLDLKPLINEYKILKVGGL